MYSHTARIGFVFHEGISAKELCPRMEEQFEFFKRNTIQDMGDVMEEDIVESLRNENRALCIVNTRKRAQMIYNQIKGEGVYPSFYDHVPTTSYKGDFGNQKQIKR